MWNCQALYHEPLARVIVQALPVFDINYFILFVTSYIQCLVDESIRIHPTKIITKNKLKRNFKKSKYM